MSIMSKYLNSINKKITNKNNFNGSMTWLKMLSFEITDKCNLKHIHKTCPINDSYRHNISKEIDINDICNFANFCKNNCDFEGYIAFHAYNEPLLEIEKIKNIIKNLPGFKFLLWTNGLLIKNGIVNENIVDMFNIINISIYNRSDTQYFQELKLRHQKVKIGIQKMVLDKRMLVTTDNINPNKNCSRINQELVIDFYGDIKMCCVDYKNTIKIGNIKKDSYDNCIANWLKIKQIPQTMAQTGHSYNICKICYKNTPHLLNDMHFFTS